MSVICGLPKITLLVPSKRPPRCQVARRQSLRWLQHITRCLLPPPPVPVLPVSQDLTTYDYIVQEQRKERERKERRKKFDKVIVKCHKLLYLGPFYALNGLPKVNDDRSNVEPRAPSSFL